MAFAALLGDAATSALDARRGGSSEVLVGGVIGGSGCRSPRCESNVEVQGELVGMRAQPDGIDLVLPLVVDPGLDDVGREDVALEQPVVRLLQIVEHDVERARHLLDLLRLGRRQLVEVLVDGAMSASSAGACLRMPPM